MPIILKNILSLDFSKRYILYIHNGSQPQFQQNMIAHKKLSIHMPTSTQQVALLKGPGTTIHRAHSLKPLRSAGHFS